MFKIKKIREKKTTIPNRFNAATFRFPSSPSPVINWDEYWVRISGERPPAPVWSIKSPVLLFCICMWQQMCKCFNNTKNPNRVEEEDMK